MTVVADSSFLIALATVERWPSEDVVEAALRQLEQMRFRS